MKHLASFPRSNNEYLLSINLYYDEDTGDIKLTIDTLNMVMDTYVLGYMDKVVAETITWLKQNPNCEEGFPCWKYKKT